ncbi:MAG: cytochrome c maturation protein CcmE [Leadbetterella sp.]|nr:cytochrome c maturation protein CcmE [Leadbetterella sp.]
MKKSHIIALGVIAIAVAMIISTLADASTYLSFKEAKELAEKGNTKTVHVTGVLPRNAKGDPVGLRYEPSVNPNRFEFLMTDSLQAQYRVILNEPKPQDMERSESIVVIGRMNLEGDYFEADKILLKCPSKYNNGELKTDEDGYVSYGK